jgi:hypothetical protein
MLQKPVSAFCKRIIVGDEVGHAYSRIVGVLM